MGAPPVPCILVVDDSAVVRDEMLRVLGAEGYRVATARDGEEALEWLRTNRPCLVLLDFVMPNMDGHQFLAAMRLDRLIAGTPVVAITSYEVPAGFDGVALSKPIHPDDVLNLVRAFCPHRAG